MSRYASDSLLEMNVVFVRGHVESERFFPVPPYVIQCYLTNENVPANLNYENFHTHFLVGRRVDNY